MPTRRGNCYATSEALYHLLGGRDSGYVPMVMHHEGGTHWFLRHESALDSKHWLILDPTAAQFKKRPDYLKARGCGFLTKKPSKKAAELMETMVWGIWRKL